MSVHKGALTLILVVLVLFGIFIAFATGIVEPLMDTVGEGFNKLVTNVFNGAGMP